MTSLHLTYLKAIACAASTNPQRFYLNGVLVECRERSVTYVATDSHVMLIAHDALEADAESNALLGHFIIPASVIAKLKLPTHQAPKFAPLTKGPGKTLILAGQVFEPIDGTFPSWRLVLPKSGAVNESGKQQHYDPPVAMRLHKAAEIVTGRKTTHLLTIAPAPLGAAAAVHMPAGDLPWFGVIMPIRRDETLWERPEWLSQPESVPQGEAA